LGIASHFVLPDHRIPNPYSHMPVADFYTASTILNNGLKSLMLQWQITCDQWHDEASARYGRDHIEPLPLKFRILLDSCARLSETLQRAEVDCQ
jgi:hypothetical protein